jgi:hypothetical protein
MTSAINQEKPDRAMGCEVEVVDPAGTIVGEIDDYRIFLF